MNVRGIALSRDLFAGCCLIALLTPAATRAHGSMEFNGSGAATSKLQNLNQLVLDSSLEVTICVWMYHTGPGENDAGVLVALDEAGTGMSIVHGSGEEIKFHANWTTSDGEWTFDDALFNTWNAVAITYDMSDENNVALVRVNFADVLATQTDTPDGSPVATGLGYCVGNLSGQNNTWEGRIAHVQVFNRVLSAAETDACLRAPGSITRGLRLWLPMRNEDDTEDQSGNNFDATATDVDTGTDGPVVNAQHGVPKGTWQVPVGIHSVKQYVIPRYADGSNHPAGQLQGHGPASVIRGNAATGSLPASRKAVVITEDYDYPNNIDYWQAGAFASLGGNVSTASASSSLITITTSSNHGRSTGETVTISNNSYGAANGTRTITVTGATTFTLDGTSGSTGSGNNGTWAFFGYPLTGSINSVSSGGSPVTVTTFAPHNLLTGQIVTISSVTGAGANINATHTITITGDTTFTVPVSTSGAGSGGKFSFDQNNAVLRAAIENLMIAGYADTTGPNPAGDDYAGRGIIDSQPAIHHKVIGVVNSISGTSTVTVTSYGHTLANGKTVKFEGILGGYTLSPPTGPYTVTKIDENTFTLNSTTGSGSHTANTGIWKSEDSWPDREHGAFVKSGGVTVEGVTFFYIPGTCLSVATGNGPGNRNGSIRPFDSEKARIWNCQFMRGYGGAEIGMVDAIVGRLNGFGLRDYGIKFTAGATQIDGALHFYGVGEGGIDQPAVWFANTAGPCWGGPIYAETSPVGIRIDNSGNKLSGVYSHSCTVRNLWITGERNAIENFEIDVLNGITENNGGEGVLLGYQTNTLSNGTIGGGQYGPVPTGEIAVRVRGTNAGQRQTIRDVTFVGTASSTAPLISVEELLNDSVIVVKCFNAGTILDLYTNSTDRLGAGNSISITTAGTINSPVNLDPTGWDDWNNMIIVDGVLQTSPTVTLTIDSGGAITLTQRNHVIETLGSASTDDLTSINGGVLGRIVVLRAAHADHTVVLKDAAMGGNLQLEGDFSLNNTQDTITLYYDGTNWLEKARRDNGS